MSTSERSCRLAQLRPMGRRRTAAACPAPSACEQTTPAVRPLHGLLRRLVGVRDDLDIITCEDAAAWDGWLAANYRLHQGVWVKITKQHTGVASVTNDGAVDVGLCWGWISGHRKALDETYFLQRYTPRRPRSNWSAVNVANVEALIAAGRSRQVWPRWMPSRPTAAGTGRPGADGRALLRATSAGRFRRR
jgi:hypothetical protein